MTITKGTIRAAVSLTLVLAVASVFTLRSLAASSPGVTASRNVVTPDDPSPPVAGKLAGTGKLMIDGEAAQPGATIVSGSRVATGADGAGVIDLGTIGQIALRPNTSVTITFADGAVGILLEGSGTIDGSLEAGVTGKLQAACARLRLSEGAANLRSASGVRWLRAGESVELTPDAEAVITGNATFTAAGNECVADKRASEPPADPAPQQQRTLTGPGLGGIIAITGVATAVTVGLLVGRNHGHSTATVRPSTVTP